MSSTATFAVAPDVVTERLLLRAHRKEDFEACRAMWADAAVARYIGSGKPSTAQQTWMRMLTYPGHWSFMGYGYWAIEDRETQEYVGEAGFADFRRGLREDLDGVPEVGYVLTSQSAGRGFATEAVRAACAWADANLESARTSCLIDVVNVPSLGVAEKCGYAVFDRVQLPGVKGQTLVLARERTERDR